MCPSAALASSQRSHGDICRNPGGHWACPVGCTRQADNSRPYCLAAANTKAPCRAVGHDATAPPAKLPTVDFSKPMKVLLDNWGAVRL